MSDMLRITGLISGMDTDATVKKLIEIEQIKVDKAEQEKQYLEWQKEDYREIANLLRGFNDEYFDVLNSDTYMLSGNTFNMFSGSATIGGVTSSAVSIRTTAESLKGSFSIDSVTQLATTDKWVSDAEVLGNITSNAMASFDGSNAAYVANKELSFTLDGVTKNITLDDGLTTNSEIAANLSSKLQEAFTNVEITATVSGTDPNEIMEFHIYQNETTLEEVGHTLEVGSTNTDLLVDLGLEAGQSNSVNTSKTLEDVLGITANQTITINNESFTFAQETTIADMMNEINTSTAGVTINYDQFNDKFTMESNTAGTDSNITVTDSVDTLFASMNLVEGNASNSDAQNSIFTVNGVTTTRSGNSFEMNGTTVTLNEIPASSITINVEADTASAKDLIVGFVDKYNEMIATINEKLSESKNYDFEPLTDAQKEEMSDDDIESWEEEARKGGLRNDSYLENLTLKLRQSLYESVDGLGITLAEIGIQSSNVYSEGGKLVIDEVKLDQALQDRPNEVIELFTKQSETTYSSFTNQTTRYNENGLSARIHDILQDNIRLTRNTEGYKGYLIEKAGLDTGIDSTSEMAKKIQEMDDKIDDLLELLADKEDSYYDEFARMESAMSAYSSQSAWLTSQFGG